MIRKITHDYEQTIALAARLAKALLPGTVIALRGDLGAGKTAFVTGLLKGLGGNDPVSSPTFTLVHEYTQQARLPLYHFDLYRLSGPDDLDAIGADDYWESHGISAIEWPDVAGERLPEERLEINIHYGEGDERIIDMDAKGDRLMQWFEGVNL